MPRCSILACCVLLCGGTAQAQQQTKSMGTVSLADAQVTGGLEVSAGSARLVSNAGIIALDHTARIALDRGGETLVCATSAFHLLRSGSSGALLFALDRGAMEIRSPSLPQDAVLTPDLRLTPLTSGPLDLRIRVTREGDTCVENRGLGAPVLRIAEVFGDALYHLAPGQHVLFVGGSVRSVVDRERSDCGCPTNAATMVVARETPNATPNATSTLTPGQAAALNPFPVAQSADLARPPTPPVPLPVTSVGEATLAFSSGGSSASPATALPIPSPPRSTSPSTVPSTSPARPAEAPPPAPPGARNLLHRLGGFFHRIFTPKAAEPTPKAAKP